MDNFLLPVFLLTYLPWLLLTTDLNEVMTSKGREIKANCCFFSHSYMAAVALKSYIWSKAISEMVPILDLHGVLFHAEQKKIF